MTDFGKPLVEITRERVEWFAAYYKKHPDWGIFFASLAFGDYDRGAALDRTAPVSSHLREAANWFDKLSGSQRRRLKLKAEDLANSRAFTMLAPLRR